MAVDPWLFLIDALAIFRLTRLITKDSLLQEVRWWILRRWPSELTSYPDAVVVPRVPMERHNVTEVALGSLATGVEVFLSAEVDEDGDPLWKPLKVHKLTELLECPFCASVWIAFAVVALRIWWDWWQYPALALGLAGVVALIFAKVDND